MEKDKKPFAFFPFMVKGDEFFTFRNLLSKKVEGSQCPPQRIFFGDKSLQTQRANAGSQLFAHADMGLQRGVAHAAKAFGHQVDANVLEAVNLLVAGVLFILLHHQLMDGAGGSAGAAADDAGGMGDGVIDPYRGGGLKALFLGIKDSDPHVFTSK